jgi:hypothetical protein
LSSGKVLVVGGLDSAGGYLASGELYDPATNSWTSAPPLLQALAEHSAVLLPDGRVLVEGTYWVAQFGFASAELYDPATNSWSMAAAPPIAGQRDTATLLTNGKVLVAGGLGSSSAALYDPGTNSWTYTGSLSVARAAHTATLLPNGNVLLTGGGNNPGRVALSELYEPSTGLWSGVGTLATARINHSATLLADGRLLVNGGYGEVGVNMTSALASTEIYDPGVPTISASPSLNLPRSNHNNVLLPDGRVLSTGGRDASATALATTELRDAVTESWSFGPNMTTSRQNHRATVLMTGEVLVTGGSNAGGVALASSEKRNVAGSAWAAAAPMAVARISHRQTLLADGSVLVTGGQDSLGGASIATAERYNATANTWTSAGTMPVARAGHRSTLLRDGRVLVTGGTSGSTFWPNADLYNPATNTWAPAAPLPSGRTGHRAVLLPDGRVMVIGGQISGGAIVANVDLYDPLTDTWAPAAPLATARTQAAADLLPTGEVIVAGGVTTGGFVPTIERYDMASGAWMAAGVLSTARNAPSAVPLPDGSLLYAGGGATGVVSTASVERYQRTLGFDSAWRPIVATGPTTANQGSKPAFVGTGFKGLGEASGGNGTQNSSTNHPVALLQRLDGGEQAWVGARAFTSTSFTAGPISDFPAGPALVTVFVNGIPSLGRSITVTATTESTTAVSSSAPSVALGQAVLLTATVAGASPTGTIQLKDNGVTLVSSIPLTAGVANFSTNTLSAGVHPITAIYSGDGNNSGSASPVYLQIVTGVVVSASPSSAPAGQPVTLRATVTGAAPVGTVQFLVNGSNFGNPVALVNGVATLVSTALPEGSNAIAAIYSGDGNNVATGSQSTTETITANAKQVPTLPEWGMVAFGFLLLATAARTRRSELHSHRAR